MALPTNIFLGKAKAPTPQTKKQFSAHKPWDQPVSSPTASLNDLDNPESAMPEPAPPSLSVSAGESNIVTTEIQSNHEVSTNPEQSQYKVSTQSSTKSAQTQNKVSTASRIRPAPLVKTQYKVSTQPSTPVSTNSVQTQNKVSTKLSFSSIVGLQRRIVLFVFDASKTSREKLTAPIALRNLADACQTTAMAAQGSTRRLEQKGLLHRGEYKNGRGGWTRYELPNDLFQELLQLETQNKVSTNPEQSQYKVSTQPSTQPSTTAPSSSSSIDSENFKTTTTGDPELFEVAAVHLNPEWSLVDVSPLEEIGFSQTHVIQLAKHGKLSATEVQDSIHFFGFDLKRNGKGKEIKGPPMNFFMGILRKGLPYAPPENYESPDQVARRLYLEGKRRIEEQRLAEERELRDLEFSSWRRELTREQIAAIVPDVVLDIVPARESSLKAHFDEHVWSEQRAAIPGRVDVEREQIRRQIDESLGKAQL